MRTVYDLLTFNLRLYVPTSECRINRRMSHQFSWNSRTPDAITACKITCKITCKINLNPHFGFYAMPRHPHSIENIFADIRSFATYIATLPYKPCIARFPFVQQISLPNPLKCLLRSLAASQSILSNSIRCRLQCRCRVYASLAS